MNINKNIIDFQDVNSSYFDYVSYFKQDIVEDILVIEDTNIACITKASANIVSKVDSFINTTTGINQDNFELTGLMCIVKNEIVGRIEYITNENTMKLHTFKLPNSSYISIPIEYRGSSKINASSFIQNVFIKDLGENKIYISILYVSSLDI